MKTENNRFGKTMRQYILLEKETLNAFNEFCAKHPELKKSHWVGGAIRKKLSEQTSARPGAVPPQRLKLPTITIYVVLDSETLVAFNEFFAAHPETKKAHWIGDAIKDQLRREQTTMPLSEVRGTQK